MALNKPARPKDLQFLVLGPSATLVVHRFANGRFFDDYDPTEGPTRLLRVMQDTAVVCEIEEWAFVDNLLEYKALVEHVLQRTDALIYISEPTRPLSTGKLERLRFGELEHLFERRKKAMAMVEGVLVLWRETEMASTACDTAEWQAGMALGQNLVDRAEALGPFVARAETGQGIDEVFEQLAAEVLNKLKRKNGEAEATKAETAPSVEMSRLKRVFETWKKRFK